MSSTLRFTTALSATVCSSVRWSLPALVRPGIPGVQLGGVEHHNKGKPGMKHHNFPPFFQNKIAEIAQTIKIYRGNMEFSTKSLYISRLNHPKTHLKSPSIRIRLWIMDNTIILCLSCPTSGERLLRLPAGLGCAGADAAQPEDVVREGLGRGGLRRSPG